jgi:hypothetical protein
VNDPHFGQANPIDAGTPSASFDHAPRERGSLTSIADSIVFFPLICIYGVLAYFGTVVKFSDDLNSQGPSTIIALVLILLGANRVFRAFLEERIFWVLGILVLYLVVPSALVPDEATSMRLLVELTGYVLLAAAVSRMRLDRSQLFVFWACLAGALLLSSVITLVDHAGIVDVPYNNETTAETRMAGQSVKQASGFFLSRSTMAVFFSLGITGSLVLALAHRGRLRARVYFLSAGIAGLLCLFLTHNRSGVLGSAAVVAVYALVSPRFRGIRRIGILMGAGLLGVIFIAIVARYYPEHATVYMAKLGFVGLAETTVSSDVLRVDLFVEAIRSLATDPLGHGYTKIPLPGGKLLNPHNLVTRVIWAAGLFSFLWIPLFGVTLYSYFSRRFGNPPTGTSASVESDAVSYALLAFIVNGMTHEGSFTGLAWLLLGLMVSVRHFSDRPVPDPPAGMSLFHGASR